MKIVVVDRESLIGSELVEAVRYLTNPRSFVGVAERGGAERCAASILRATPFRGGPRWTL